MQLENSFQVGAPPDKVFAYLLDINKVVGCVPGAELSEVVDSTTFKGRVKIKVGPITVSYNGTARIAERDEANRVATLQAEGRETTGPGSARATARMTVETAGNGSSTVHLTTDYTVAGRIANFGRGVMEDVSRRLVNQMADCIKANLEAEATAAPVGEAPPSAEPARSGTTAGDVTAASGAAGRPAAAAPAQAARPVNALSLLAGVLWDGIRRLFGRR
ncbi:MAG TPA: SRPBCC family protein [Candidatus Dormibacteraeota bacterium]